MEEGKPEGLPSIGEEQQEEPSTGEEQQEEQLNLNHCCLPPEKSLPGPKHQTANNQSTKLVSKCIHTIK